MKIPKDLIQEINKIVGQFNSKTYKKNEAKFIAEIKGSYLYLNREVNGNIESVVRIEYTGDIKKLDICHF